VPVPDALLVLVLVDEFVLVVGVVRLDVVELELLEELELLDEVEFVQLLDAICAIVVAPWSRFRISVGLIEPGRLLTALFRAVAAP